jgi:small subunit ribosomal protein S17
MTKTRQARKFAGTVVKTAMTKTITVAVETSKVHPKYGKRYKVTQKFLVHDEANKHKLGDKVSFVECRPLSKLKRWRVID